MAALTPARQGCIALLAACNLLAGCGALEGLMFDAQHGVPTLRYQCPNQLRFEARLFQDLALLDGMRGYAVLPRTLDDRADAPIYADDSLRAEFGLGMQGRLVRLSYAGIPAAVYCERISLQPDGLEPPLRASTRRGPQPPPPPVDPNAPVPTNIRLGDGRNGPG